MAYDEAGQAEVEKALEKFAEEGWEGHDTETAEPRFGKEDMGEAISRDQVDDDAEDYSLPTTKGKTRALQRSPEPHKNPTPAANPASKRGTPDTSRPSKKKRKKGNAIDDLFSGLG
ncbi:hypothetical protein KC343_g19423 [Hortaea werneckii]|nr:hypothetical protein KC323_g4979 [Hortaea werneckii]KAI6868357.1 hypothetical protein KC338_g4020 [Hortaea werneckii]KAI7198469.1 hypothetical protein KC352_g20346 [Hortaea werneckii]KAI7347705.1 hypothetical protein KC320_g7089 [Hortaea werneckii]KAI7558370.1 hypothetical protein KC317_g11049 [Hortaea werneckii]